MSHNQYSKSELIRRYLFLCVSLTVMAVGTSLSIKAGLGTSPISSLPYTLSCMAPLSVGTMTILLHIVFILLQKILLRKDFELVQLMQLPVAIFFGYMTDFALYLMEGIVIDTYWEQWLCCGIGLAVASCGIAMEVAAGVVMLAGEGLILAIVKVTGIKFGTMKTIFDVSCVVASIILSLVFLSALVGVREGTIASALLTGSLAKLWGKPIGRFTAKFFH